MRAIGVALDMKPLSPDLPSSSTRNDTVVFSNNRALNLFFYPLLADEGRFKIASTWTPSPTCQAVRSGSGRDVYVGLWLPNVR